MNDYLRSLIDEKKNSSDVFKRNVIKEYLQVVALTYIYAHESYRDLVFYGGSALRHCYGLPRLSEDLDFVDTRRAVNIAVLAKDLAGFFIAKHHVPVTYRIQKFRCTLRFPILRALGLVEPGQRQSDFVMLKIEVYDKFDFCVKYGAEIKPLFKYGESCLIKTFDLPTMMATKLRAIMLRKWEKTSRQGAVIATAKGRDYFDLMWYLEQGVKPNMACIELVSSEHDLYARLIGIVDKLDKQSIKYDLLALIENTSYVDVLKDNLCNLISTALKKRLAGLKAFRLDTAK